MSRLPIGQLRALWEKEGEHGPWRALLRAGYGAKEPYFEFGVMPEPAGDPCEYRVVLDHEVPVSLCPANANVRRVWVIRPDEGRAGQIDVQQDEQGFHYHTLFVSPQDYATLRSEAERISKEYADERSISFWSVPNKWFADTQLVQLLTRNIVNTADYQQRPALRQSWYWP
jgi:hypothetical protein